MHRRAVLALCLAGFLAAACNGMRVPPEKDNYVGQWRGLGVELTITRDGGVAYKRVNGSGRVSVNAPLAGFDGDDFIVGISVFKTTFTVNRPPHLENGVWKMEVEGVELERVRGPGPRRPVRQPRQQDA